MEKDRRVKIIILSAIIIAVLGLTIAFAALSGSLSITGSSTMDKANWEIYFDNLSSLTLKGSASVTATLLKYEQAVEVATAYGGFENIPSWPFNTSYWLGSAYNNNGGVWGIESSGYFGGDYAFDDDGNYGVRPVITISKSEIN